MPYSQILVKIFDAHINVQACSSAKAIKYIYKYITKGYDQEIFDVRQNNASINSQDEVQSIQAGRYISSNEAI